MLIEVGHFSLILALVFSFLSVVLPSIGLYQNRITLAQLTKPLIWGQFFWILVAVFILINAFLVNDFSVRYVAENSNTQLPTLFKVSALWAAHEGSLLLWVFILSLWSIAVSIFSKQIPSAFLNQIIGCFWVCQFWFFVVFITNIKSFLSDCLFHL